MVSVVADRVKETTATTGTGTLSLAGAVAQFRSFIAGVGSGNQCNYCILSGNGIDWETGAGTVTSGAPNTLSRTTVFASSNANALVSLTGTSTVFLTEPASSIATYRLGDNRIINGDMRIDQRNNGASGAAVNVYTVDRWFYQAGQATKGQWQRNTAGAGLIPLGYGNALLFTSTSAYASVAGDVFAFRQPIEADLISDFAWGTANAQPVTLSFWLQCSLAGTLSGVIANAASGATRSYPFTFANPVAGAWTKVVVTIPGDTGGAWIMSGNGVGACLFFDLGTGVTFRGPAGAWASANYVGATGSVSVVGTNTANFFVTGVKLEIGSVATPFNRQSLAKSMADCQRYYVRFPYTIISGYNGAGGLIYGMTTFPAMMRTNPAITFVTPTYSNTTNRVTVTPDSIALTMAATITATGAGFAAGPTTCDAEL